MVTMPNGKIVTVFGGSGFVGRHIIRALARRGWRVRAAVRRPDLAGHLQPLGGPGQVLPIQANLRYDWSVERAVEGADAVINLVGILYESRKQSFTAVHEDGARAVAEATKAAGISSLTHMSALGSDPQSSSDYARSKAAGERAVREVMPEATIVRPSIVFGPEDMFFNQFAWLARMLPVLPLISWGTTKFQPVYVGDVAAAFGKVLDGEVPAGVTYELGGPQVKTYKQCLEQIVEVVGRKRLLLPWPAPLAKFDAWFLQMLPKPLLTIDQVRLLETDIIVSDAAIAEQRTLDGMDISATTLAAVLPTYLYRFREHGQFQSHRPA